MTMTFTLAPEPEDEAREAGRLLFAGPVTFVKGVVAMSGLPPADRLEEGWLDRVRSTAAQISAALGHRG